MFLTIRTTDKDKFLCSTRTLSLVGEETLFDNGGSEKEETVMGVSERKKRDTIHKWVVSLPVNLKLWLTPLMWSTTSKSVLTKVFVIHFKILLTSGSCKRDQKPVRFITFSLSSFHMPYINRDSILYTYKFILYACLETDERKHRNTHLLPILVPATTKRRLYFDSGSQQLSIGVDITTFRFLRFQVKSKYLICED